MVNVVKTDLAPSAIGPYSQAIKANGFVFCSGQIPLEPKSMQIVTGSIQEQTVFVFYIRVFLTLETIFGKLEGSFGSRWFFLG